jgi:hypothetical protein
MHWTHPLPVATAIELATTAGVPVIIFAVLTVASVQPAYKLPAEPAALGAPSGIHVWALPMKPAFLLLSCMELVGAPSTDTFGLKTVS